jgi:hypothetical protein
MASPCLRILAGNISAGVGFTIYAVFSPVREEPLEVPSPSKFRSASTTVYGRTEPSIGGRAVKIHGKFTVGWVWS